MQIDMNLDGNMAHQFDREIDREFDRQHIWHPYTNINAPLPVYAVQAARGCELILADDRRLIDGTSSWWSAVHGYHHPILNAAVTAQLQQMSHVMFGGITHQPAIKLAQQLLSMLPSALDRVFFADSGSIAVEVAIKMALQYQMGCGQPQRHKILALQKGYHGDTFAAMAVCDPFDGMHEQFRPHITQHFFAKAPQSRFDGPWLEADELLLRATFAEHHAQLAAMIIEPILQGAGGMRLYHPNYVKLCRELCDHYGVLLICDEIATGFGRTGRLFAIEHADVVPDIICLGKALSGGYMSLAATICQAFVAQGISAQGALMHGPTFMANPLACAVAFASCQLIAQGQWQSQVASIEAQLKAALLPLQQLEHVVDVRVLGAVGIIEFPQVLDVAACQARAVAMGAWLRPFGRLLYVMPPFIIDTAQLRLLTDAMQAIAEQPSFSGAAALPGA